MFTRHLIVAFVLLVPLLSGCVQVGSLAQTRGLEASAIFNFTVSPDDRWIVYFERTPVDGLSDEQDTRRLRVFDVELQELHRFDLPREYYPYASPRGLWAPDSTYCLFRPPAHTGRAAMIDVADAAGVSLVIGQIEGRYSRAVMRHNAHLEQSYRFIADDFEVDLPDQFTCSDCPAVENTDEILAEHVPRDAPQRAFGGSVDAALSHDANTIFYLRGAGTNVVNIWMRNIATGSDRNLGSHRAGMVFKTRVNVSGFQPSPDGNWLAYRVSRDDGNWVDQGEMFVINLKSGRRQRIDKAVYYDMRWTSDSSRLYYYQDEHLKYAQIR